MKFHILTCFIFLFAAGDLSCIMSGTQPCTRFEFMVSDNLLQKNIISAEIWFHVQVNTQNIQIKQIVTNTSGDIIGSFDLTAFLENDLESWKKCKLPSHSFMSSVATENAIILEVINTQSESNADIAVGVNKDEQPILIIRIDVKKESPRRSRSITCTESITSCCKENFFLNFSTIGWDNWILHPDGYDANFCRGTCLNDFSNTRFIHSAILLRYIADNRGIAEQIGLNMCCSPSVMSSISIIYRDEEGQMYYKRIDDMKVEACNCA